MNQSLKGKILLDLFPPPKFLAMPAVGLDVADEMVRFVGLKRVWSGYEIDMYGARTIPTDVIEEGYIKNKAALVGILSDLRKQYSLSFVNASLPEEKAYLFKTQLPPMNEADIRNALRFKIEENVPISLQDAIFDYRLIDAAGTNTNKDHLDISVTVIHSKVVTNYLEAFHAAGLVPLELKLESQAIAKVAIPRDRTATLILVMVRETKTVVAIVSRGIVQFSTTIAVGGRSITESIKKNFSVGEREAEDIREGRAEPGKDEMFMALANSASVLRDEIQRFILYWQSHNDGGGSIAGVILAGSDVLLGLDEYLARSLDIPVSVAQPWDNILSTERYLPAIVLREALDYLPALGLALPNN